MPHTTTRIPTTPIPIRNRHTLQPPTRHLDTPPRIVIATDGSVRTHQPGTPFHGITHAAAWAWWISEHHWRTGPAHTHNPFLTELEAIRQALLAHPHPHQRLTILSDCQGAIHLLTHHTRHDHPNWETKTYRELAEHCLDLLHGRDIHLRWVKGHAGHHLNQHANRLARATAQQLLTSTTPTLQPPPTQQHQYPPETASPTTT